MVLERDALSQILNLLRLRGSVYFKSHLTPPFSIHVSTGQPVASFHLGLEGSCWIAVPGVMQPVHLLKGDLIVLPNSGGHIVSDEPGRPPEQFDQLLARVGYTGHGAFVLPGIDEAHTVRLVCGHFEFDQGVMHPILSSLPPFIHLPDKHTRNTEWLDAIFRFVSMEMSAAAPGADAIVHRLTEIIFIQTLRAFVAQAGEAAGCLAGVLDPQLGRALAAMHDAPGRDWSVDALAGEAGLSRTRFAERFAGMIGVPPMAYLTTWRMLVARRAIIDTTRPIVEIAGSVGYSSDEAFTRAFRKQFDMTPAELRRRLRDGAERPT